MNEAELIAVVTREIRTLADNFDADDYADAVDTAEGECGFSLPQSGTFKVKWLKDRTKRALFFSFISGDLAEDFQYKQVHLEHPFKHFLALIQEMDRAFEKAIEENPEEFADVSAALLFGTKIDAGFQYDPVTGDDTTYTDDNEVIFNPTESD